MKLNHLKTGLMLSLLAAAASLQTANAQVLMSAGTYTQNFDSLLNTGTANPWADNSTLPGWYASRSISGPAITTYRADNTNTGAIYSFGATASTERALGSASSGTPGTLAYGVRLTNDTANAQTNITISYTGEQWRNGGNTAVQKLAFSYQIGVLLTSSDAANAQSWTAFTSLDFSTPTVGATLAVLDGNAAANRTVFSGVVLPGVSLQPGQEIFLRWSDINDAGNDHSVAVDDLTVSFTPTAPAAVAPAILTQPTNKTVFLGDFVSYSVTAGGTAPFTYQWYYPDLSTPISGATNQTFAITNCHLADAGTYFVNVANAVGNSNSSGATLTINTRTPIVATNIAFLRGLMNTNFLASDTTNLYTATGTVTTFVDMTSAANDEFFMQDGTAGIAVFIANASTIRPNPGDIVQVTGPLGNFNGLLEFNMNINNPAHSYSVIGSTNLPAPIPFDLATVTNVPAMKALEGSRVVVTNVYLAQGTNLLLGFPSGGNVTMTNLSGNVMPLFVNASEFDVIGFPIPEVAASVIGVLGQFTTAIPATNGFELDITTYPDLVAGTPLVPLSITTSGGNVVASWSAVPNGFNLEQNSDLNTATWAPVAQTTNVVNSQKTVTFTAPTDIQFLRLRAVR